MPVYQEKDKSKWTKDGRKYYFKCYYTDKYGKRKQKQSKLFKGIRECEKAERDFLNQIQNEDVLDNNVSFAIPYNEWLQYKENVWKSTTAYRMKQTLNKHIFNFFKDYKLHNIKINILIEWKNQILNFDNISNDYKNKLIGYMLDFLDYAVKYYNFDSKVANKLQKKKFENVIKEKESKWNFWTYEDFKIFISNVDDDLYYTLFNFLYYTGLRIGECIALNWNDINLEKKTLNINKTLSVKISDKPYIITKPKTEKSIRTIDLDDKLVKILKSYKKEQQKIYLFNNEMFVFGNIKFMSETTIRRNLDKYINKSNNIRRITPHGFRHSHVSLLVYLGLDLWDIAERIGDTVEVVEKTYYHMFPDKKSKTVNALNNLN